MTQAPVEPSNVGGIPFTLASRPQKRFANVQTISNLATSGSFQPIQLAATGWVRKISLLFTASYTTSASAAVVAGDAPWNLITGITLTDATGQPITTTLTGYQMYLKNKYCSTGSVDTNIPRAWVNPHAGPEFAYAASGTSGSAVFRLDLDLEQDYGTGYGCVPNLDANASLQLKIDYAAHSVAFSGGTASAATLQVRVDQHYWATVTPTLGGQPVNVAPPGAGDYVETRYETQTVSAATENLTTLTNRGGAISAVILVSRAAGVRTAFNTGANFGFLLDNQPIDDGILTSSQQDEIRRTYGYIGTDLTTSYAPLTAGTLPGLDTGVMVQYFGSKAEGRRSWLPTKAGSLLQVRFTPGASATQLEVITVMANVEDAAAFYDDGVPA